MNGRIYDPRLGRMLQADPFVQNPKNSQSLNRYSYVLNNPLSYTDPSGYFSIGKFFKKYWRVIVAAVAVYVTAGIASGWAVGWGFAYGTVGNAVIAGAISGFVGGAILTGTLKGAFYGGLTGAALGGIGASGLNDFGKVVASGTASGITTELQGGKFGHGFLSAGVGFWTGLKLGGSPSFEKFLGAAIAGGTVSQITGGKFGNGAVSAGLAYVVAAGAASAQEKPSMEEIMAWSDEEFFAYFGRPKFSAGGSRLVAGSQFSVGNSTRTTESLIGGSHRVNWLGVSESDWMSTGLDILLARRRGIVPDLQFAREYGVLEQQYETFSVPVQWWTDEHAVFHQIDIGNPVSTGTYWRPPIPSQLTTYSRLRWRMCYWSSCTGGN